VTKEIERTPGADGELSIRERDGAVQGKKSSMEGEQDAGRGGEN